MPNVAEIIKEHGSLEVRCLDRLYLNGYVPRLQSSGGVVDFLVRACGQKIPSPVVFGQLTSAFKSGLRRWAAERGIPWIEFRKGERKDTVVQRYRDRFAKPSGVVLIGVAQERASASRRTRPRPSRPGSRVSLHYTPTYSSWLNQVELWFAKIERDCIARGIFTSTTDLRRKLMHYIRAHNKTCRPFRWAYTNPRHRIRATGIRETVH